MKKIQTTRFGTINIGDEHLISFRDGMIGFSVLKKYVLIESPAMPLVFWLQSIDSPEVAFPVIEPYFFKRDYKPVLNEADECSIGHIEGDRLKIFNVLTIPEDAEKMTVNLKAPIVININRGLASQVILQEKALDVRMPAHEAFSKAMMNSSMNFGSADDVDQNSETWTAVDVRTHTNSSDASA